MFLHRENTTYVFGKLLALIGAPPGDIVREVICACSINLTYSKGNTDIPLSSYGLYLNLKGDVRNNCAPQAPCLEFNKLFAGPLEVIAKQCGFADKLARLVSETPFSRVRPGRLGVPACLVSYFVHRRNRLPRQWQPIEQ